MLVSNTLPATATRADWSFAYLPTADPVEPADGTLTVIEETGKVKRRTVTTAYGVQFAAPVRGCRCVLLVKAGHAGDLDTAAGRQAAIRCGDVYRVILNGDRSTCTCPGFALGRRRCKHMLALLELVATGDLPDPLANGEADRSSTEPADVPFGWFRRREATADRIEEAAAFLRSVAPQS